MCHNVLPYERTRIHLAPSDRLPLIRRHEQAGTSHLEDKEKNSSIAAEWVPNTACLGLRQTPCIHRAVNLSYSHIMPSSEWCSGGVARLEHLVE